MAIDVTVDVLPSQLWVQGDVRDPLGIWSTRQLVTGDATGGSIKVSSQVPAALAGAYVYQCMALTWAQITGVITILDQIKARLLVNWPDADAQDTGIQGYSTLRFSTVAGLAGFTPPIAGAISRDTLVMPNDRFLLLFDPRASAGAFNITELEIATNTDAATYSFEAYGYFWDRGVLNAPGGPRHPGSA